jgi:hypothetical protein
MRLLGLLLVPALVGGIQAAQEADARGALEVRVVNASTGEPLPRTALTLRPYVGAGVPLHERPPVLEATTGPDGLYRFDNLEPGTYFVQARKSGFCLRFYNPRPRSWAAAPIVVKGGKESVRVEMALLPQAIVTGRVLDEEGEPVAHAAISLERFEYSAYGQFGLHPAGTTYTSDLGDFRLAGLTPGRYLLWVRARGELMIDGIPRDRDPEVETELDYAPVFYPNSAEFEGAQPFDLEPGTEMHGVEVHMRKSPVYRVRGRVQDHGEPGSPDGVRLAAVGQSVFAALTGPRTLVRPDGTFEFAGVPPGEYEAQAQPAEGVVRNLWKAEVRVGKKDVDNVVLERAIPARVSCEVRIEGEKEGGPDQPPVAMTLMPVGGNPWNAVTARPMDGPRLVIEQAPPGRYWVQVGGLPRRGAWLKSILIDGREAPGEGVVVTPGASLSISLVFAMEAGQISGVVVDKAGEPVPGSLVTLVPERSGVTQKNLYRTATAGSDGRFTLPDLAPGEYRVYAWEDLPGGAHHNAEFLKPHQSKSAKVEVETGGRYEVTLKVIPEP